MHRIVLLLFACMLLSAGCLTASESGVEAGVSLITPADPVPLFDGQATYVGLIGAETPQIQTNYSLGCVVIPPGNATPPHILIGTTELVYVIDGVAEIHCDNQVVTAREGETVLLPERVLQSIASAGDTDLRYLTAIQPPYTAEIEISGETLTLLSMTTNETPFVVADPRKGIEWSATDTVVYTLANPVLMSEMELPINYSVAYGEIQPGGYLDYDGIVGSSDLIYVIEGELLVTTLDGRTLLVPAGSAAYVPPGLMKESRNTADSVTKPLSFVDPAWTQEKTALWK
ncbi:MAG: Cupin 2, conserved barrel domain protein [Methanoculleus marisnigri]|uniref:Cupin 2, conserved barrel domain protein n=1 Tax=Methanoculleus marisnigri TaxID=2198 RepID=A0A101GSF1_9EURY|nr:MAG: Cupin 2, conserved barrel domain protein [Methanoculleus marisnigri]